MTVYNLNNLLSKQQKDSILKFLQRHNPCITKAELRFSDWFNEINIYTISNKKIVMNNHVEYCYNDGKQLKKDKQIIINKYKYRDTYIGDKNPLAKCLNLINNCGIWRNKK